MKTEVEPLPPSCRPGSVTVCVCLCRSDSFVGSSGVVVCVVSVPACARRAAWGVMDGLMMWHAEREHQHKAGS